MIKSCSVELVPEVRLVVVPCVSGREELKPLGRKALGWSRWLLLRGRRFHCRGAIGAHLDQEAAHGALADPDTALDQFAVEQLAAVAALRPAPGQELGMFIQDGAAAGDGPGDQFLRCGGWRRSR